jgi:hypothetical protein
MLILNVIIDGEKYRLPVAKGEKEHPRLRLIHKGIIHIFKPVLHTFPGHEVEVTWDEDLNEMKYSSGTVHKDELTKTLNFHHGNLF